MLNGVFKVSLYKPFCCRFRCQTLQVCLSRYNLSRYTAKGFPLSPHSHTSAPICSGGKFLLAQTCEVLLGSVDNRGGDPG